MTTLYNYATKINLSLLTVLLLLSPMLLTSACDSQLEEYEIQIQDHKFSPDELTIESNKKIRLIIKNLDTTFEEFESHDLSREKMIAGNKEVSIIVGPLKPGIYKYFGEFHPKTAQGIIIVK